MIEKATYYITYLKYREKHYEFALAHFFIFTISLETAAILNNVQHFKHNYYTSNHELDQNLVVCHDLFSSFILTS